MLGRRFSNHRQSRRLHLAHVHRLRRRRQTRSTMMRRMNRTARANVRSWTGPRRQLAPNWFLILSSSIHLHRRRSPAAYRAVVRHIGCAVLDVDRDFGCIVMLLLNADCFALRLPAQNFLLCICSLLFLNSCQNNSWLGGQNSDFITETKACCTNV